MLFYGQKITPKIPVSNTSVRTSTSLPESALESAFDFNDLGDWLIRQRQAQGVTQRELAARIGVLQPALARMERERFRGVGLERLVKIVEALGVSLQISATIDPIENWSEQARE